MGWFRTTGGIILIVTLAWGVAACGAASQTAGEFSSGDGGEAASQVVYFAGSSDGSDIELWRTDGTVAGTYLVKDINPSGGSYPYGFTALGGLTYFAADDGSSGVEPWVTDGTEAGTRRVKDINPNPFGSSNPIEFTVFGGKLFFAADAGAGNRLWMSDGAAEGTVLVPGLNNYGSPTNLAVMGDRLYFSAALLDGGDTELWVYDGFNAQVAVDINPSGSSYPNFLTDLGGKLYFSATSGALGDELHVWDGASATVAKDVCNGVCSGSPSAVWKAGARIFFSAETDGGAASELWAHDGVSGVLVKDIYPGQNAVIMAVGDIAGRYIFQATSSAGRELWTSDGTADGTVPLVSFTSNPTVAAAGTMGGYLYVLARDNSAFRLWRTDGTPAGTTSVYQAAGGQGNCSLGSLGTTGGRMLFHANNPLESTGKLWISDGTQSGTQQLGGVVVETCGF